MCGTFQKRGETERNPAIDQNRGLARPVELTMMMMMLDMSENLVILKSASLKRSKSKQRRRKFVAELFRCPESAMKRTEEGGGFFVCAQATEYRYPYLI